MSKMLGLVKRNLLVYFKDKSAVIFSMLTPIIVLVLYLLFLKSNLFSAINGAAESIGNLVDGRDIDSFISGLLLCGILGTAMITVPYNTLSILVRDREGKVDYDVSATPVKRHQIILSYYISSVIAAFIMTSVVLTAGLILISAENNLHISAVSVIKLYGIVLLGSMSATSIFMPIMILFKNSSAVGAFMGIISSASGFVVGAYIPLYQFSEGIQTFCNIFPATGITILLKRVALGGLLDYMDRRIGGVDNGMFAATLKEAFGFNGRMQGNVMSAQATILFIVGITSVFILVSALTYPKVYKHR